MPGRDYWTRCECKFKKVRNTRCRRKVLGSEVVQEKMMLLFILMWRPKYQLNHTPLCGSAEAQQLISDLLEPQSLS